MREPENYDGSEPLANPRREIMACAVSKGEKQIDAYELAGYSMRNREAAIIHASQWCAADNFVLRVNWLQAQSAKGTVVDAANQIRQAQKFIDKGLAENLPAGVAALKLQSELAGLLVQRSESDTTIRHERAPAPSSADLLARFGPQAKANGGAAQGDTGQVEVDSAAAVPHNELTH